MDYDKLKAELTTGHPVTGPYSDDHEVAADQLNAVNCTRAVESVSGQDIFEAVDGADFVGLSESQKSLLYAIIGMGTIFIGGVNTRAALLMMFGPGTTTRVNLAVLQKQNMSQAEILGLRIVVTADIEIARGQRPLVQSADM